MLVSHFSRLCKLCEVSNGVHSSLSHFFFFFFQDLISVLLPRVLPAITVGLQDLDDDVRAVAAAALIPVVDGLVQLLPNKVRHTALFMCGFSLYNYG